MDKNQNKKPKNSAIYIISVIMLITVLVIAVVSAIGTANRTEDKIGIDTDEAVITGKKDTKTKDTKTTDKVTGDTTKDTEDTETKDTKKNDATSQAAAPVDSFVTPEPWDMPGYDAPVIMAAGAFVAGSSIELSADGPIKPPYAVYFQGGLTWYHAKFGIMMSLEKLVESGLVQKSQIIH